MENKCDFCKNISPYKAFAHEGEDVVKALFFLPGIPKEHLDITLLEDDLTVVVSKSEEVKEDLFEMPLNLQAEFHLHMPCAVNADKIESKLENGCLCITLPKAESAKPRKIEVG